MNGLGETRSESSRENSKGETLELGVEGHSRWDFTSKDRNAAELPRAPGLAESTSPCIGAVGRLVVSR